MTTTRLLTFVLLVVGTSCTNPDDRPTSWDYVHAAIISPSCATVSCHSDFVRRAGVSLQDPDKSLDLLLEDRYVVPGDPNSSLIYMLEGNERSLMPPDAPLPPADVELIRQWILEGAIP